MNSFPGFPVGNPGKISSASLVVGDALGLGGPGLLGGKGQHQQGDQVRQHPVQVGADADVGQQEHAVAVDVDAGICRGDALEQAKQQGRPGDVQRLPVAEDHDGQRQEAVAANVPDSYRMGIELMAGLKLPCGFQWDINATLSRNRVENFTETLYENEDPAGEKWSTYLGDTHIAFSPDFLLNNRFGYTYKGFEASLQSQYVSKQYMSNLDCKDHILDAYFVSNLNLSYTFALPKIKSITIGCTIYNLFNEEYENNGYAGSGFYYEDGQKVRYNYAGYAAQAGTNVLGHISLRF